MRRMSCLTTWSSAVLVILSMPVVVSAAIETYSSALTTSSPHYRRPGGTGAHYYYQAIPVNVSWSGNFTFESSSNVDVYGYFYQGSFDSSNPSMNLLAEDDDSSINLQFKFTVSLMAGGTYVLVVTTYSSSVYGSFSVTESEYDATISFSLMTVQTTTTITATTSTTTRTTITNSAISMTSFQVPMMISTAVVGTSAVETTTNEGKTITSQYISRSTTKPSTCSQPIITLIPDSTSMNAPAQFRRYQDFYISSNIILNCPLSLSILARWTITNCTSSCSASIRLHQSVITTNSELFIPARTLDYGIYQLILTVIMVASPTATSSASAYVEITPSGITANLVQFGTSIITSGHEKNLLLDPGSYSVDPDQDIFDPQNWDYAYYCRPYDLYQAASPVSMQSIDQANQHCFLNQSANRTAVQYNSTAITKSSVIILAGSLAANETYQFVVFMVNRRNPSVQATGYLLVQVEDTKPQLIVVACVISTMCSPNIEYQFINPTTQVALFSVCIGNCSSLINITWNIYQGWLDVSTNVVTWNLSNSWQNYQVFGMNTSNLTVINDLFLENFAIFYWRFEVIYTFPSEISSSALNFRINQPPGQGSCSIDPLNGTTSTIFTINCSNWVDDDGIKDYSFYTWTNDASKRLILGSTVAILSQVRLPAGDGKTGSLNVVITIRDSLNCITEYTIFFVVVTPDNEEMDALVNVLQQTNKEEMNTNPIIQLLAGGNQNTIGQILASIGGIVNEINNQNTETAISNGVPLTVISISPLGSSSQSNSSVLFNVSALNDYKQQLNKYAAVRDYLISYAINLQITTADSIKLQACTLAKMTEATSQLTRTVSMLTSSKCQQLSRALFSLATKISYEDVQLIATYIAQCATNVLTAVNGPLQERSIILDLDFARANTFPDDYDTDLESEWARPTNFGQTIEEDRNRYYQQQTATIIADQVTEIFSWITAALNIHLNIGQNTIMDTSSVFVSMETVSIESLSNQLIEQTAGAQIRIPSNFNLTISQNTSISLRSIMQPLASSGSNSQSQTNLSTAISLSLLDRDGNDISIQTNIEQPIELIIPRDPNVFIPSMTLQNVTTLQNHNRSFHFHFVNISRTDNLTVSFHLEMHPHNQNLSYWFIYKFDDVPQLNQSIDGWTLFCPSNLTSDGLYTYFIDNQRTSGHQSIVFGLRELKENYCPNIPLPLVFYEPFNFSENYEIRTYTSGCYYLDANNNWKSDGLIVGSLTNHYQTQCFSTHLTTFTGGFVILPAPINWDYVFANVNKSDVNKVHSVLDDDDDEASIRALTDLHRKTLPCDELEAFVIAVPKSLGSLNYLRIRYDNTSREGSASWFLKYTIVSDLQMMIKAHFIRQRWLVAEEDAGMIECLLPLVGEYRKEQLDNVHRNKRTTVMCEGFNTGSITMNIRIR